MTQEQALDILKLGRNVFLTGPAGSGKTYLLNKYIEYLRDNDVNIGITASTGIAATHMGGITIHSWSGLGIKDRLTDQDLGKLVKRSYLKRRFNNTHVLIIDEISMFHHFQLDLVDVICRAFKQNSLPFGGMQIVLCGDFFQLPPVAKAGQAHFAHKSSVWTNMDLQICYLEEQYRQDDDKLTAILNEIRTNNTGEYTLEPLRARYKSKISGIQNITKLYTHNLDVDAINNRELARLSGNAKRYTMTAQGKAKIIDALQRSCLAPTVLILKKDAIVMFVKNNFEEGYVNGTLGVVIGFNQYNLPIVETLKGEIINVTAQNWKIEEEGQVLGEIRQLPLRLAWAITVHKSQGMTLDAAEIDLSKSFTPGMGYVALSRIRNLEGLRLMGLNDMALKVDHGILDLDSDLMLASQQASKNISQIHLSDKAIRHKEFLTSILPAKKEKKISTYDQTKELVKKKLSIAKMAKQRELTEGTIMGHLEELAEKDANVDLNYLRPKEKRFKKIAKAFSKTKDTKLSPVRDILGEDYSYDELRIARLFLKRKV